MKFETTRVWGFEHAMRGMRNPKESWLKSDSGIQVMNPGDVEFGYPPNEEYIIGAADMELAQTLIRAGSEHRKFLRQIFVSVDITAPIFWWKEFDTYRMGVEKNSTSTMHTLSKTPIGINCFEIADYHPEIQLIDPTPLGVRVDLFLDDLEQLRQLHLQATDETEKKIYWKELIRWLPCGWLQKRTVTLSYESLLSMCSVGQRRFHKLGEWSEGFIKWARSLPYAQELIFVDELPLSTKQAKAELKKILNQVKQMKQREDAEELDFDALLKVLMNEEGEVCA